MPVPALRRDIGVVIDAVSHVRELTLVYNDTDGTGWSHYAIRTQNATGFSPNLLPVDLLRSLPVNGAANPIDSANEWRDLESVFYLKVSAALSAVSPGFLVADRMTSLAAAASANGTLRFLDTNTNGRVDSGDRLDVLLPPTGSPNRWETYLVRIGNWSSGGSTYGAAVHVILVGPEGPLEALAASPSSSSVYRAFVERPTD